MKSFIAVPIVLLAGVLQLSADTIDMGQIVLEGSESGYQQVGIYNFTGATQGCDGNAFGTQYNICNAVNIASWSMQITYTSNIQQLTSSTLNFSSNGAPDVIGPTDSNFDLFTGDANSPWTVPFDLTNTGCSPTCDAYITQIVFTATLDNSTLQLYNAANGPGGPYINDTLSSSTFTTTWNVPLSDYTDPNNGANADAGDTDSIYDSTELLITNQSSSSSTPEPGTASLLMLAIAGIGFFRRRAFHVKLS